MIAYIVTALALAVGIYVFRKKAAGVYCKDVVDLTGKVVIITGGNTGLGLETAKQLAKMKGHIIIACRNESKAKEAVAEIKQFSKNDKVEYMLVDMSLMESVRNFVKEFEKRNLPLHILINNAAIVAPYELTKEGLDIQLATNHLGPFLMTRLFLPKLYATKGRVVTISSWLHTKSVFEIEKDKLSTPEHRPVDLYSNTKAMNILFTKELAKRVQGKGLTVNTLRPGMVLTSLANGMRLKARLIFNFYAGIFGKTAEQGVQTILYAAISPEIEGKSGMFLDNCGLGEASEFSTNPENAAKLWKISSELVGLPENLE